MAARRAGGSSGGDGSWPQRSQLPLLLLLAAWSTCWSRAQAECCGSIFGGTCEDGSVGTPCCGKRKCKFGCCGCEGGCRRKQEQAELAAPAPDHHQIPLRQWPMIMAHDAATTYAEQDTCTKLHMVNNYAVTQSRGTFKDLLDCGARALDLRPFLSDDGKLIMHHGDVLFKTPFEEALSHTVEWANSHPGELVLIMASHAKGGSQCGKEAAEALKAQHINRLQSSGISSWTLGEAIEHGKLPGKGSVLWVDGGDVEDNYNSDIGCYNNFLQDLASRRLEGTNTSEMVEAGRELAGSVVSVKANSCYGSNDDRARAFDPLWKYFDDTANPAAQPADDKLWNLQAHWQYNEAQIAEGTLRSSCILQDERWSELNRRVAQHILEKDHQHINLLEVDYVCNHGQDIFSALQEHTNRKVESMSAASKKFDASTSIGHEATSGTVLALGITAGVAALLAAAVVTAARRAGQNFHRLQHSELGRAAE